MRRRVIFIKLVESLVRTEWDIIPKLRLGKKKNFWKCINKKSENSSLQHHTKIGIGRDLWKSPDPTLPQAETHRTGCLEYPDDFRISPSREDSTTLLSNLLQCSVTLTIKTIFPLARWNIFCFNFFFRWEPTAFCTGHHWKVPGSIWLHPPSTHLLTLMRFPLIFFTSFLNLSSYVRCTSLLIIFAALHWTLSSMFSSLLHWGA